MSQQDNLRVTRARHWVGLLLLLGIASHANDATMDHLALHGTVVDAATGSPDTDRLDIHLRKGATIDGTLSLADGGPATGKVRLALAAVQSSRMGNSVSTA